MVRHAQESVHLVPCAGRQATSQPASQGKCMRRHPYPNPRYGAIRTYCRRTYTAVRRGMGTWVPIFGCPRTYMAGTGTGHRVIPPRTSNTASSRPASRVDRSTPPLHHSIPPTRNFSSTATQPNAPRGCALYGLPRAESFAAAPRGAFATPPSRPIAASRLVTSHN